MSSDFEQALRSKLGPVIEMLLTKPAEPAAAPADTPARNTEDDEISEFERRYIEEQQAELQERLERETAAVTGKVEQSVAELKRSLSRLDSRLSAVESKPAQVLKTETVVREVALPAPAPERVAAAWDFVVESKENGLMRTVRATSSDNRQVLFTITRTPDFFPIKLTASEL